MNPPKSHWDVKLAGWTANVIKASSFSHGSIILSPLSETLFWGPGCGLGVGVTLIR